MNKKFKNIPTYISNASILVMVGGVFSIFIFKEQYLLIVVLILFISIFLYYLSCTNRREVKYLKASDANKASNKILIVGIVSIVSLNILAIFTISFTIQQLFANIIIGISIYPLWRYIKRAETGVPFFPLLLLLYGLYYGIAPLLPLDTYVRFRGLPEQSRIKAQIFVVVGLLVLLLSFYRWPINIWGSFLPRVSLEWSEVKAKLFAVVLGILGLAANITPYIIEIPDEFGALVYFCRQLSLVAISTFFLLQLRKRLNVGPKLILWLGLLPLQILVDIGSGFVFPVFRLGIILFMIYIVVRRKMPWRWIILLAPIVILLLGTKMEFRAVEWEEGRPKLGNPIEKGVHFFNVSISFISKADVDEIHSLLTVVAQRLDLISIFSYVVNETPNRVPFWMGETYTTLLWKLIPRFLYPDKPKESLGQFFGHEYLFLGPDDFTTSVNFPQLVEMYANFGLVGVILGMFLIGILYQILYHLLNHLKVGNWGIVSSVIVFSSLMNIESNFSLIYGGLIYWFILLYILGIFVRQHRPIIRKSRLTFQVNNQKRLY